MKIAAIVPINHFSITKKSTVGAFRQRDAFRFVCTFCLVIAPCSAVSAQDASAITGIFDPVFHKAKPGAADPARIKSLLAAAAADPQMPTDKAALIDTLVKMERGLPDDRSVPESVVVMVKKGLAAYPRAILCLLLQNNCFVYVAPFVIRADPTLAKMVPANYAPGSSFLNCRAVFTPKGILIGAYFYRQGKLLPNPDPYHGVQHESAHAIDQILGRPSLSDQFVKLCHDEREAVSAVDRGPLTYYLNGDFSGSTETFAQLLAHKYCHFTEQHTLSLVRCFPKCVKFIDQLFPPVTGIGFGRTENGQNLLD